MESDHDRIATLAKLTSAIINNLIALLEALPVPIAIPAPSGEEMGTEEIAKMLLGLHRAQELVEDEPIPDEQKAAIVSMIADVFTAYEVVAALRNAGPAPWRFMAATYAIARYRSSLEDLQGE